MTHINRSYFSEKTDLGTLGANAQLLMAGKSAGRLDVVGDLLATVEELDGTFNTVFPLCQHADWSMLSMLREDIFDQLERSYPVELGPDESMPGGGGPYVLILAVR